MFEKPTGDYRKNTQSCFLAAQIAFDAGSAVAHEWWNGEGVDFSICDSKGNEKFISLHMDEISVIVAVAKKFGFYDKGFVKELSGLLNEK